MPNVKPNYEVGVSLRHGPVRVETGTDDMAQQQYKEDADINNIMAKYIRTGVISHVNKYGAMYGNITPTSYQEAQNIVLQAREMFAALPGNIRARFEGKPENFLEFVQDPANAEEMVALGLATKPPAGDTKPAEGTVTPT